MIGITASGPGAPGVLLRWGSDNEGRRFGDSYLHTFQDVDPSDTRIVVSWDEDEEREHPTGIVTAWCVDGLGQISWLVCISLLGTGSVVLREGVPPEGASILKARGSA